MRILAVEDEPAIARLIKNNLQKSGHVVDVIEDGNEAKNKIDSYDYDVAVLDIMLPGADGYEICQHIRNLGLDTKILMLTAKDDIDSKVLSLNMGADDYMTKPFSLDELEARVRALGRREKLAFKNKLKIGSMELDPSKRAATINKKLMPTTLIEFRLLEYLIRNQNRFCTRTMLSENVWGGKEHNSNTISVTVSRLRSKIAKLNGGNGLIRSVPKSGYAIF